MFLKQLSLVNFKNHLEFDGEFSEKINCFVGNNGMGKTNLLDAIYYLSFCKSFFNTIDSQNIKHQEAFFVVQGHFQKAGEIIEVYCGLKRNQKKIFKKNKKEYERLSEHIGQFPLVMISPSDSELINGSSEQRRRFLDGIISQVDKSYLDNLIAYSHVLKQRNALLKQFYESQSFDPESLDIWNDQLMDYGSRVIATREKFLTQFIPLFNEHYQLISGSEETAALFYESSLIGKDYKTAIELSLQRDRAVHHTSVGPHKDDLDFLLDNYQVKKYASQGQQKSYLLALKLAQFKFVRLQKNIKPLLLLDDVYDKLDETRFTQLLELVSSESFGQVFITDTHPERMEKLLNDKKIVNKIFVVREGKLKDV